MMPDDVSLVLQSIEGTSPRQDTRTAGKSTQPESNVCSVSLRPRASDVMMRKCDVNDVKLENRYQTTNSRQASAESPFNASKETSGSLA